MTNLPAWSAPPPQSPVARTAPPQVIGATKVTPVTVTGSKGGNAALASLLTALASLGLIVDSTT